MKDSNMPNWCNNLIIIAGDTNQLAAVKQVIKSKQKNRIDCGLLQTKTVLNSQESNIHIENLPKA